MKIKKKYKKYLEKCSLKNKKPKSFPDWLERRRGKKLERQTSKPPPSKRTIQDFVEDMISEGLPLEGIKTVVSNTHWATKAEEIMGEVRKFQKNLKKSFSKLLEKSDNILS